MLHGKLVLKIIGPRKMKLNIHTAGYVVKLMKHTAGYSTFEFHYVTSGIYIYIFIYIYTYITAVYLAKFENVVPSGIFH